MANLRPTGPSIAESLVLVNLLAHLTGRLVPFHARLTELGRAVRPDCHAESEIYYGYPRDHYLF